MLICSFHGPFAKDNRILFTLFIYTPTGFLELLASSDRIVRYTIPKPENSPFQSWSPKITSSLPSLQLVSRGFSYTYTGGIGKSTYTIACFHNKWKFSVSDFNSEEKLRKTLPVSFTLQSLTFPIPIITVETKLHKKEIGRLCVHMFVYVLGMGTASNHSLFHNFRMIWLNQYSKYLFLKVFKTLSS